MTRRTRLLFYCTLCGVFGWGLFVRSWGLADRPFWRDEAWVAQAVEDRTWQDLLHQTDLPLPPLFAVVVQLLGDVVSPPEIGYRLFSVLCGIAVVPLVYLVARTLTAPRTIALAGTAACASSVMLVIWSRELKQYEFEAFASVLLAWMVFSLSRSPRGGHRWLPTVGIPLTCLVAPWIGYGAIFPAAALAGSLLVLQPRSGARRRQVVIGACGLALLASSAWWLLRTSAGGQAGGTALDSYMGNWFIQWDDPQNWLRAGAYAATSTAVVVIPFDWMPTIVEKAFAGAAVWAIAMIGIVTWPRRGRIAVAWWVFVPWILMLAAAVAHRYPFGLPRMMMYWAPPLALVFASGIVRICRAFSLALLQKGAPGILVALLVTLAPAAFMVQVPLSHRYWVLHDFPAMLNTLATQRTPGDQVVVGTGATPCVRYYLGQPSHSFHFTPVENGTVLASGFDYEAFLDTAIRSAGRRCWVLATHQSHDPSHTTLLRAFQNRGFVLSVIEATEPSLYGNVQLLLATRQ